MAKKKEEPKLNYSAEVRKLREEGPGRLYLLWGPEDYLRLNAEAYGGMIDSTWLDRPLGIAGRVFVRKEGRIEARLFATEEDVALIPNLAIHFNREVNSGYAYNRQVDLCPLLSAGKLEAGSFDKSIVLSDIFIE